MSTSVKHDTEQHEGGWLAQPEAGHRAEHNRPARASDQNDPPGAPWFKSGASRDVARRLVEQDRYIFVLLEVSQEHLGAESFALARKALAAQMALIPAGPAPILRADGRLEQQEIPAVYIDRLAVTNRQFQRFVEAGCYDRLELWPSEVWPSLMKFTDQSRQPGPSGWDRGRPPAHKADHPVVGICWHEAQAYAQWVGKRLPTAGEWQKVASWPEQLGGGCRYPWGDLFDPARGNFWASGRGDTVAVSAYPAGDTPNGIRQMAGNVWEWLDDPLDAIPCAPGETFEYWRPMRRIIGGAFDTYLASEATCDFVTGQGELDRRHNIGFRCAVSADMICGEPG
jgi:iron(II)-dependent oxidoreductase